MAQDDSSRGEQTSGDSLLIPVGPTGVKLLAGSEQRPRRPTASNEMLFPQVFHETIVIF